MTKNRRDSLKSKKQELKIENTKELAMIRVLEGKIHFAKKDIEEAIESYNKAKSTLVGIEPYSMDIKGLIDYQFGEIAKLYNEHENVVNLIESSVTNLSEAGNYETAIDYMLDLVNYIHLNKLDKDALDYANQADQLTKKHIKDNDDKRKYIAEIYLAKGRYYKLNDDSKGIRAFKEAVKEFSKLRDHSKTAEALIEQSKIEKKDSLKKAEKTLMEAIDYAKKVDAYNEMGLAMLNLAHIRRIIGKGELVTKIEADGFEAMDRLGDKYKTAEQCLALSRIIVVTSHDESEISKAIDYATKASNLFDEVDNKYGKTVALFTQGFMRVAKGYVQEGMSMIKLTKINLKRLMRLDQTLLLESKIPHVLEVLLEEENGKSIIESTENVASTLEPLDAAILYHLISILRFQENTEEGIQLINHGLELTEKFVKKNKEYLKLLDVIKERAKQMTDSAPQVASSTISTEAKATPMDEPVGLPKTEVKQPKVVKKGGPDLSKK